MGNSNSQETSHSPVDSFYLACRSGDVDAVKQILPTMKLKEINRVHSDGNTALHIAASHGHFAIVELLLNHGCSTTITNKAGKTAAQVCEDEQIRRLIQSSGVVTDNNDAKKNDHTPKSKWCRLYENSDNQDKPTAATKIMKLRLKTYLTNRFIINENNPIDHIKKVVIEAANDGKRECKDVMKELEKFEKTKNPSHLIRMYTIEEPFYRYVTETQNETYFMELLISLTTLTGRSFQGYAYRGIGIDKFALDFYIWAWHHPASFIEMLSINSASASRQIAQNYASHGPKDGSIRTIFTFYFPEPCKTAIDIRKKSSSEVPLFSYDEKEILVIPGTFFEVTSIEQSADVTIINLKNILISNEVIVKTINELK